MKNNLVWYVCYGSNLAIDRLLCYFTGKGNEKFHIKEKAENKYKNGDFKPLDSKEFEIKYKLYFANNSSSVNWGKTGVCFIDKDTSGSTIGRAYLMYADEYEHLHKAEGVGTNWYNAELSLGYIDEIPVKTFTNKCRLKDVKPCKEYIDTIIYGLKELGKSKQEIDEYLKKLGISYFELNSI